MMAPLDDIARLCINHDLRLAIARDRDDEGRWWARIVAWDKGRGIRVDQRGALGAASATALSELKSQLDA